MTQIIVIVQARMGSTRLPGKVLKHVLGRPLLHYLFERLRRITKAQNAVIATTKDPKDDPIVDFCNHEGISYFRGSEEDVLDRYLQAARFFSADVIVRVTSDCPLIDPELIDQVIEFFLNHQYDYVSNTQERKFPRGMDVEIFSFKSLEDAANQVTLQEEREHVTLHLYRHPERYSIGKFPWDKDDSQYRLTVDTPEDFELISKILAALYPNNPQFNLKDILHLLQQHPEWAEINAHIKQKNV